jgi:CHAT domain-containing protein
VNNVQAHLQKRQYQTQVFLAENASEENLKQVRNPKILHISTHGFFIDKKSDNTHISPMLRSGLLFAGVSDRSRSYQSGQEDGVLTAQEAANLELDETDLVVLSACETGLGDVKSGEGVYGLQRAFRVAGAKTLIMSHWKVDDAVTQELMSIFYEQYAVHHDTRRAFREARESVKKKHHEPYFWAAFEMFGE